MESAIQSRAIGQEKASAPPGYPPLYPIALKIAGERCLVVGGGAIARRKTEELLACGATVHVVAPEWKDEFDGLPAARSTRPFAPRDLEGAFLVVAATDDPEVQETVAREARARGILCNVVDVNRLCSYYVPAVLRRGALSVAVTTEGKFPLLAVALKERVAELVGPRIGEALDLLAEARARAFARFPGEPAERLRVLRDLVSPEALDLVLGGRLEEFEAHVARWKRDLETRA